MTAPDLVVRARRVVTPEGERAASVRVRGGTIEAVGEFGDVAPDDPVVEVGDDAVLLPGLVDTHVHVNEPGRTEWEGFETATLAAAAGGVTAIVDMPLNSIPATSSVASLESKRAAADGRCRVDVAYWGGVVPGNEGELAGLVEAGACGFKCFLVPSGVDEFAHVGEAELRRALPVLAELGVPLLAHAELPGPLDAAAPPAGADPRRYATWLAARPAAAEVEAVELLVRLCRETGARVHVVHVSAAAVLPVLLGSREEGLPITAETCPHYLTLAAEDVPDGATEYKCAPPIRGRENRERLWQALADGDLDLIASDHSPCPPELKLPGEGDFLRAWGGIASLELGLAVLWTSARTRGFGPADLARWMSAAPARLAGLARKGAIAPGFDADLVVWQPDAEWTVDPARLRQRHKLTPYTGMRLTGVVEATYIRGEKVYARGEAVGEPMGRPLTANR